MSDVMNWSHMPQVQWNKGTRSWEQVLERVMAKIEMVTESGCWIWMGTHSHGYGMIYVGDRHFRVHSLLYRLLVGPIHEGLEPDHLCRVRLCASPHHLEPVTHRINSLRGQSPGVLRMNSLLCTRGHEWNDANTRLVPLLGHDGINRRFCRSCERERAMRRRRGQGR